MEFWQQQIGEAISIALRLTPNHLNSSAQQHRIKQLVKASEAQGTYNIPPSQNLTPGVIPLNPVAQINNTYIVVEHPNGMWLVEQHIAHERVLYEQIQQDWQLVPIETPILINSLTPSQLEQLQRIGIEVEPFGEQLWAMRNVPALLQGRKDLQEALIELSHGGDLTAAQVAVACRSAIRNGTPLDMPQMENLIAQWQKTGNPRTCPHGRPIYLSLEESSLARFFRRHWVIGKSHGI